MQNRPSFFQRSKVFLFISVIVIFIASQIYLFGFGGFGMIQSNTSQSLSNSPELIPTPPTPTPTHNHQTHPTHENGMVFPRWDHKDGYGLNDTTWTTGLNTIKLQAGARWVEMPILFSQNLPYSTVINTQSAVQVDNFAAGVKTAKMLGFKVFMKPIINPISPGEWAGSIRFTNVQSEQAWFDAFWQAYEPYIVAAAQNGVDQVSIGTELEWLQLHAPASLWEQYISRARSVFSGTLTYDTNWTDIGFDIPTWMQDKNLDLIGVSEYISLVDTPTRVEPGLIPDLWKTRVLQPLDAFATRLGKPIFLSEIGYRNSADTLYQSYDSKIHTPDDPDEQAAACDAALQNIVADPQIVGAFFWGWRDTGAFDLVGLPAVQAIANWYKSPRI